MKISTDKLNWLASINTFTGSEKDILFATSYEVTNPKTDKTVVFEFTHSTGPEFDPNTSWVYKSKCGIYLIIENEAKITARNAENYLKAKTR